MSRVRGHPCKRMHKRPMQKDAYLYHKVARDLLIVGQVEPKDVVEATNDTEIGGAEGEGVAKDEPHDRKDDVANKDLVVEIS